jgi:hydrogenase large subunit
MNGNQIGQAYSSGTMVRGIEIILRDRDPRDAWAFAQRICGVCTLVHGIASIRSVENGIFITCTRWTGWTSCRPSTPTRPPQRYWRNH